MKDNKNRKTNETDSDLFEEVSLNDVSEKKLKEPIGTSKKPAADKEKKKSPKVKEPDEMEVVKALSEEPNPTEDHPEAVTSSEPMEIAITVSNLKISYRMMKKMSIQRSLLGGKREKMQVYEAVKGVSFDVPKGEIVGLIGKNGSGKSTILRAIAGILQPDSGSINLHGNSVSLLAIGVGFKPEMTGRENIMLSGLLLGFTEAQINEKLEEIIAFAELGDFIDYPVKTYSSGMYSKLAFSITAVLETKIMLIDEVLSVGDENFKKKSYTKMKELINNKERTVVVVSHNISTLKELCSVVIWMHEGEIMKIGEPNAILKEYQEFMNS